MNQIKSKKFAYILAALLSFLFPGMGHIFIGKIKRGFAIFFLFYIVFGLLEIFTTVLQTKLVFLFILCVIDLALRILIVLDAVRFIKKADFDRSRPKWFYYVIMLAILIALGLISRIYAKPNLKIQFRKAGFEMFDDVVEKGDYFAYDTDLSISDMKRFDFVIYNTEFQGVDGEHLAVGRIIALPRERITVLNNMIVVDDSTSIPINNEVLAFFFSYWGYSPEIDSNTVLLLTNSTQIPAFRHGLRVIELQRIKGKLLYIYFPLNRINGNPAKR